MAQVVFLLLLLCDVLFNFFLLCPYGLDLLPQILVLYEQFFLLALRLHLFRYRDVLVPNRVVSLLLSEHGVLVDVL